MIVWLLGIVNFVIQLPNTYSFDISNLQVLNYSFDISNLQVLNIYW